MLAVAFWLQLLPPSLYYGDTIRTTFEETIKFQLE